MWYIFFFYNGMLLSNKKEQKGVICSDVDGPRVSYREKSEREKQVVYTITYTWNIEKWYRCTYLQGRNRNTCREQRWEQGGGEGGANREIRTDIYPLSYVKRIASGNLLSTGCSARGSGLTQRGGIVGWREAPEGGDICTCSWFICSRVETVHSVVKQLYSNKTNKWRLSYLFSRTAHIKWHNGSRHKLTKSDEERGLPF